MGGVKLLFLCSRFWVRSGKDYILGIYTVGRLIELTHVKVTYRITSTRRPVPIPDFFGHRHELSGCTVVLLPRDTEVEMPFY